MQQYEWITDKVIHLDVVEHGGSDCHYFPFDELLEHLLLTLSRDQTVFDDCAVSPQIPVVENSVGEN